MGTLGIGQEQSDVWKHDENGQPTTSLMPPHMSCGPKCLVATYDDQQWISTGERRRCQRVVEWVGEPVK